MHLFTYANKPFIVNVCVLNILCVLQSISEEEQQRILGEQKMVGFKKAAGIAGTASKKSTKAKVSVLTIICLSISISKSVCLHLAIHAQFSLCYSLWFYKSFSFNPLCIQSSPVKPKRPISAMFIFAEEKRQKLQQERPDLSESELTRHLARQWNDLSDKKKVNSCMKKTSDWSCWYLQQWVLMSGNLTGKIQELGGSVEGRVRETREGGAKQTAGPTKDCTGNLAAQCHRWLLGQI